MQVRVKRNTGFMGAASKIVLKVDEKVETKLKNNEEYILTTEKESVKIKAKQMYFGSNELKVNDKEKVEIKMNPMCILLFVFSFILIFTSGIFENREMKLVFALVGLCSIAITMVYCMKSWFVLKVIK